MTNVRLHGIPATWLHYLRRTGVLMTAVVALGFTAGCMTIGGSTLPPPPMASGPNGSQRIQVVFPAPVPVGHRVEVRWYRSTRHAHPFEPIVRDLDSGIVYQTDWALETGGVLRAGTPLATSEGLRTDITQQQVLTGRVTACRVLFIPWSSTTTMQTEITIIPDGGPAATPGSASKPVQEGDTGLSRTGPG